MSGFRHESACKAAHLEKLLFQAYELKRLPAQYAHLGLSAEGLAKLRADDILAIPGGSSAAEHSRDFEQAPDYEDPNRAKERMYLEDRMIVLEQKLAAIEQTHIEQEAEKVVLCEKIKQLVSDLNVRKYFLHEKKQETDWMGEQEEQTVRIESEKAKMAVF